MHLLTQVTPLPDYKLALTFGTGETKVADINPFLQTEAFESLHNPTLFNTVANKEYYVEWLDGEVDLSADTLWHISTAIKHKEK
ncbi:DUF2442 domain-containing protein [Spirosoma rhododendri]|uniref:DUF2442 domain-containing protein n=1 Tax=Spirosoma rhododendri TaxID=2728024 RepID=A0A7L5DQN9_9BACT|nr:DUF2442 domain-containing protein [Spirosoma rhododendri]QJD78848.1 DUF2442 domain-containing protein [Spirosoma rhododendri]